MYLKSGITVLGAVLPLVSLASIVRADVGYPSGTQNFETMNVGDNVTSLFDWIFVNTSSPLSLFTVVAADDLLGTPTTRGSSTRWLRVTDRDAADVQNRFYSIPVSSPAIENYRWTFFVNLEATPPGGSATKPKITIQHLDAAGFANAWGVEFTSAGANLIVLGIGGTPASSPLYSLVSPTGIANWVKLTLTVNFDGGAVSASVNDGAAVSLPMNLIATADKKIFRFCYRGEGSGNANTMLIDDVSVAVGAAIPTPGVPTFSAWGMFVLAGLMLTALALRFRRSKSAVWRTQSE